MKKSKKFVLAGLALLAAITMVLLPLAGCKNDSVPPEVEKQEQTNDTNDTTNTEDNTSDGSDSGTGGGDTGDSTSGGNGGDTTETDTFTFTVFPEEVKVLTDYTSPNNTGSEWTYVEFGEWPQTIKADTVIVYETESKQMGMFTYYLGNDDNYYVKHSNEYYKVEPIVWRVLNKDYASTGKALLLAEKILTGGIKWADSSNIYMESYIRKWLNGNNGTGETSDYGGAAGFLQTAFTESAWKLIELTSVDNSAASTNPASNDKQWKDGKNEYASDTPTTDKIFLLSQQEATNSDYGFDEYDRYVGDDYNTTTSTRIRVTTDYAEATGAYQDTREGHGGLWWLRSPGYDRELLARVIWSYGVADDSSNVSDTDGGVVPALSISLTEN